MPWKDLTKDQQAFLDKYFKRRFSDFFLGRETEDDNVAMTGDYETALASEKAVAVKLVGLPLDYAEVVEANRALTEAKSLRETGDFKGAIGRLSGVTGDLDQAVKVWGALVRDLRDAPTDVAGAIPSEAKVLTDLGQEISDLLTGVPLPLRADVEKARLKAKALTEAQGTTRAAVEKRRIRKAFDDAFDAARDGLQKADVLDQTPFAKTASKDKLAAAVETARKVLAEAVEAAKSDDSAAHAKATTALTDVVKPVTVEDLRQTCETEETERKKKLVEIGKTQKGLAGEISRLMALPQDTAEAGSLQRKMAYCDKKLTSLLTQDDLPVAEKGLTALQEAIAALTTEEAAIAKATALRIAVLKEWSDLGPDLRLARAMHKVSPEIKADVKAFANADLAVQSVLNSKSYGPAQIQIDLLKPLMAKLLARKTEFDLAEAKRVAMVKARTAYNAGHDKARETPPTMPEVAEAVAKMYAAATLSTELSKQRDWDGARKALEEAVAQQKILVGLKGAADLAVAGFEKEAKRFNKLRKALKPHEAAEPLDPDFIAQLRLCQEKLEEARNSLNKLGNLALTVAALDALDLLLKDLVTKGVANETAILRRDAVLVDYALHEADLDEVWTIIPNTDALLALRKTAEADYRIFKDKLNAGAADTQAALDQAVLSAKAFLAKKTENTKAKSAAKKACEKRQAPVEKLVDDAIQLADDNAPDLHDLREVIVNGWNRAKRLHGEERYVEALAQLEETALETAKAAGLVPAAGVKAGERKVDFEARYSDPFKQKITDVLAYETVAEGLEDDLDEVARLQKLAETHATANAWFKGQEALDALEPLVARLVSFKAEHDQRVIDRDWLKAERKKIAAKITQADDMAPVNRKVFAAGHRYDTASGVSGKQGAGFDYAKARAGFGEYIAAIDSLLLLKAEHDLLIAKRVQVDTAVSAFETEVATADDMRPVTPEIAGLIEAYQKASALYMKHYWGFDFDSALASVPAYETAALALAAKETDHDLALAAAELDAGTAETELDTIDPADLKKKTATEQLALLDRLRGAQDELTDKQREMQRKVYMAMDLDPDFVKIDDERRDKLIDTIKNDQELHAAKDTWATETPEKKVALLQKTLKAECAIYGMPEPQIILFEEPPGDLGSFNSGTGTINLNIHPEATFDDFFDTIDTIVHENAHNYQDFLVKRLKEGLIEPGDPEYKQALMFAANDAPGGYVDGDEDRACYEKEPLEEHAWRTGGSVQEALKKSAPVI